MTDTCAQPDEFTPRERGLLMGNTTAERVVRGLVTVADPDTGCVLPAAELLHGLVREPRIPRPLYDMIISQGDGAVWLAASYEPEAEREFWAGFVLGVRAKLFELTGVP